MPSETHTVSSRLSAHLTPRESFLPPGSRTCAEPHIPRAISPSRSSNCTVPRISRSSLTNSHSSKEKKEHKEHARSQQREDHFERVPGGWRPKLPELGKVPWILSDSGKG